MAGGFSKDGPAYAFGSVDGRLAQFKSWGNERQDWQAHWRNRPLDVLLAAFSGGRLGEMEKLVPHLPTDGPILEAGCGLGQLVYALDERGYEIEGVDYAADTVAAVQAAAPHLKLRVGDVYNLDVADGHYAAYISIGVFEHLPAGPGAGLRETRRVLRPGGVALIALPHLNRERARWLGRVPEIELGAAHKGFDFYQYYYAEDEIHRHLHEAGLELQGTDYYGLYSGLTRDFLLGRRLDAKGFYSDRLRRLIERGCQKAPRPVQRAGAHMALYICRAV